MLSALYVAAGNPIGKIANNANGEKFPCTGSRSRMKGNSNTVTKRMGDMMKAGFGV